MSSASERKNERSAVGAPNTLTVSRTFDAPRDVVFKAWGSADHMKRWFSPDGCSVPEAEVDFRPGGVCAICMRLPDGREHWTRGAFAEVSPFHRLVIDFVVSDGGVERFSAHTVVAFEEEGARTTMTVRQSYEIFDESFRYAVAGATEGWRTTLDKLEREVARMKAPEGRSVSHATFTLERGFDVSPARLFQAFVDPAAKARWFSGGGKHEVLERAIDVRPGGRERLVGRWESGLLTTFDAIYLDVVPNERLVYVYEMTLDARKISVSLATLVVRPAAKGARLTLTEQGAFLDGYDDAGSRQRGTDWLLDRLAASLRD
jgi:uncharacterized protein YndB with AHSA1/START domain